jgi:hypothetical protein
MEAIERFFSVIGTTATENLDYELTVDFSEISNPKLVVIVGCFGLASNILGLFLFHGPSPVIK